MELGAHGVMPSGYTTPYCCCHLLATCHATPSPSLHPWKHWLLALILSSFFMTSVWTTDDPSDMLASHSLTSSFPTTYYFPPYCSQVLSCLVITSNCSNPKVSVLKCTYSIDYFLYLQLTRCSIPLPQFLDQGDPQIPDPLLSHHPSAPFCFVWPLPCSAYHHMAPHYANTRADAFN